MNCELENSSFPYYLPLKHQKLFPSHPHFLFSQPYPHLPHSLAAISHKSQRHCAMSLSEPSYEKSGLAAFENQRVRQAAAGQMSCINSQDAREPGLDTTCRGKLKIHGCFSWVHSEDH